MKTKTIKLLLIVCILILLISYLLFSNEKGYKINYESFKCIARGGIKEIKNKYCYGIFTRKDCKNDDSCRWLETRNPFQGSINLPNKVTRNWNEIESRKNSYYRTPPGSNPNFWDNDVLEDNGIPKTNGCRIKTIKNIKKDETYYETPLDTDCDNLVMTISNKDSKSLDEKLYNNECPLQDFIEHQQQILDN